MTPEEAKTTLQVVHAKCLVGRKIPQDLKRRHKDWSPCLLSPLKPVKSGGCIQVSCGQETKKTLTSLILLASGTTSRPKELQASHLCGKSNCANSAHIILENSKKNNQRKNCRGYIRIPRRAIHVRTASRRRSRLIFQRRRWVSACNHDPHCIVFD